MSGVAFGDPTDQETSQVEIEKRIRQALRVPIDRPADIVSASNRRVRAGLGLVFVWVAAMFVACSIDESPDPSRSIRISIAERVAVEGMDSRQILANLDTTHSSAWPYLNAGWYPPLGLSGAGGGKLRRIWSRGPAAVVEIQLATVSELSVTISGGIIQGPERLPTQILTVLWNDQQLETLVADEKDWPLRFNVPVEAQQLGLNRMVLLPHHWFDPSLSAQQRNEPDRGVWVESIQFSGNYAAPRHDLPPAVADGMDFSQRPETVLTYYSMMPKAARLSGRFTTVSPGTRGRIVLSLEGEPTRVIFDSEVAADVDPSSERTAIQQEFDVDLSRVSGRPAGVSFIVNGSLHDNVGTWVEPVLLGRKSPTTAPKSKLGDMPRDVDERPNFLIVLFDTLRADATEPYGAPVGHSPTIARLAREGTLFQNAFSTAASTRVSVSSILTGLYPPRHNTIQMRDKLPEEVGYLPQILSGRGYRTIGVVNNPQVSAKWGFSRGFDAFEELYRHDERQLREDYADPRERARWTFENFIQPSLSSRGEHPFFVYLHELDPHFPYEPLPPYDAIEDNGYRGAPLATPGIVPKNRYFFQVVRQLTTVNKHSHWLDPASLDELRLRYAGEVAYMDAYLGWILDYLEDSGLRRNTVVVFVSDHGEEFLEHGRWGHGRQLYDPAVRVPLIVSLADGRGGGKLVEAPVGLIDIMPTLLRLSGTDVPDSLQGLDLFSPSPRDGVRPTFAYGDWTYGSESDGGPPGNRRSSIRIGKAKLICTRFASLGDTFDTYELYDLADDPAETINLWFSRPVLGHAMRQRLDDEDMADAKAMTSASSDPEGIDPELLDRLHALGYSE